MVVDHRKPQKMLVIFKNNQSDGGNCRDIERPGAQSPVKLSIHMGVFIRQLAERLD